jgi:hypothetical protein
MKRKRFVDVPSGGKEERGPGYYTRLIESDPGNAEAYLDRGGVYAMQGDRDRALEDFNRAVELEPRAFAAYLSRGNIYKAKGDPDKAIQAALSKNVDGIILFPTCRTETGINLIRKVGTPFILIGRRLPDSNMDYIVSELIKP